MKKLKLSPAHPIAIVLAAATMIAAPVTSARSPAPFKATIAITENVDFSDSSCPANIGSAIVGSGQATQMGSVTLQSADCIIPADASFSSFVFFSKPGQAVVLTAANGDRIFATYNGTVTNSAGVGAVEGGFTIIDGTGHFLGVKGGGTVKGVEQLTIPTAKGQIQLNGTILF